MRSKISSCVGFGETPEDCGERAGVCIRTDKKRFPSFDWATA